MYYKFQALENTDCSYETFSQHVPYDVKKAGPSDCGTCLCRMCLNPELKIEKLIRENLVPTINLEYVIQNDDDYHDLLENIKLFEKKPSNLKINCVEWNLVSHKGKSGKETKISRKEVSSFHLCDFAKKLAIELTVLKDISIEHTCSTEQHSKPKGWRQRKVLTLSPSKLIDMRMLASVRHKR